MPPVEIVCVPEKVSVRVLVLEGLESRMDLMVLLPVMVAVSVKS